MYAELQETALLFILSVNETILSDLNNRFTFALSSSSKHDDMLEYFPT